MCETVEAAGADPEPVPRSLCDVTRLVASPASAGVAWKLTEAGRQLDANVVHLPPGRRVDAHVEPDLDVLLLVVAGEGTVTGADGSEDLTEGTLLWLPRGSRRSLAAGDDGLSYLTVHQRRPGLSIRPRRD
ncbi:cupin domain-containing protein [Streptomyces poonensis]|uniref:cupin domain-containing protein n=1 Tax=Streptomyces poonensis TaxID=68255 RepID=UPI001674EA28|nr:AraC family ligand binding domain-containing protein [Streptomyces poonensis]